MNKQSTKSELISDIEILIKILDKNYKNSNFCVEQMSILFNVSITYLREIIEKNCEICPQKLIEGYRLQKSLDLLKNGLKEYEIINRIGYFSTRSFRRAFKNRLDILPSEYRELISNHGNTTISIRNHYLKKIWPPHLYNYFK